MSSESSLSLALEFHPLTSERWDDLEALFGEHGAYGGCWCMWWRLTRAQFAKQIGEGNRRALRQIVESGEVPGILAYAGAQPVAWCSIGPRESFPALERSRKLKRVDDQPVWSIVCFFVAEPFRRQGLMVPLLRAAVEYARKHGATIVEGYPVESQRVGSGASGYMGIASAFRAAGFTEVLRRSENQAVMRYFVA